MKKNMGSGDKLIRLIIAAVVATLFLLDIITGVLGITLLIVSSVFVLTSLINFCPLYVPFGINTCSTKDKIDKSIGK